MRVEEVMTKDVVTVKPADEVVSLVRTFAEEGISGVPVVDDEGALIGVCSETDVLDMLKSRYSELKMVYSSLPILGISFVENPLDKKIAKVFEEIAKIPVEKIMTKKVYTLSPSASVSDAVKLMAKHNINRVPIVDGSDIVGIVSRGDVIRAGSLILGREDEVCE